MKTQVEITPMMRSYLATFDNYLAEPDNEERRALMGDACDRMLEDSDADVPGWRERATRRSGWDR